MAAEAGEDELQFDLQAYVEILRKDDKAAISEGLLKEMQKNRREISEKSRHNFILDKEMHVLDEKIKRLIKHQLSIEDIERESSILRGKQDDAHKRLSPISGKMVFYEQLFALLQRNPRYFARLATKVTGGAITSFVQTVIFDMYGDQYDSREERLLLQIFRRILHSMFEKADNMGSFLRANTAITNMLSAYAKRGAGLGILKDILAEPLQAVASQRDLNLEIDPSKVYLQLITQYESSTGKKWGLPKSLDSDQCASLPQVRALIVPRIQQLEIIADHILKRIIEGVDKVPYGMRWICKQLNDMARQRFPDADDYQVGSLVGGYIYLRFFNPAIVSPHTTNFISGKPTKTMQRNFILVAKVLQNLSNGIFFKDKEKYMMPLNEFLHNNHDRLQGYFGKLTAVEDLDFALEMDNLLGAMHTGPVQVNLSYNQILECHALLDTHRDWVTTELGKDDPLHAILQDLGRPHEKLPRNEDDNVLVRLVPRAGTAGADAAADALVSGVHDRGQSKGGLSQVTEDELANVLRSEHIPLHLLQQHRDSLETFLPALQAYASSCNLDELADNVVLVMASLRKVCRQHATDQNAFVTALVRERDLRIRKYANLEFKVQRIREAKLRIQEHNEYLLARLDTWKMYLDNVRLGGGGAGAGAAGGRASSFKPVEKMFQYAKLKEAGVIVSVDSDVSKHIRNCRFQFSQVSPALFKVDVIYKKVIPVKVLKEPMTLNLEDLLEKQSRNDFDFKVDSITLSTNHVIHLLNKEFPIR